MGLGQTRRGYGPIDSSAPRDTGGPTVGDEVLRQEGSDLSSHYPSTVSTGGPDVGSPGSEMTGEVNRGYVEMAHNGPTKIDDATVSDDGRRRVRQFDVPGTGADSGTSSVPPLPNSNSNRSD